MRSINFLPRSISASSLLDLDYTMDNMDGTASSPSDPVGMDMGMGGCQISMLWNWNTVGACFISSDWQISSKGVFAGSVVGVFFLVILLEFFRRLIREYDRKIARDAATRGVTSVAIGSDSKAGSAIAFIGGPLPVRPTIAQQAVRSTLYMVQFAAGYMLMLLAMYYNGYILIFGIFMGAWAGFFLSSWDTITHAEFGAKDTCC